MDYDNFGTKIAAKRQPSFLPNRVNGISGKQLISGTGFASDVSMESNALFAFRDTFSEQEASDGFRLGIDQFDNKAKFFIGNQTRFMKWDGANATINGILYSTEGNIAGWVIGTDALTGSNVKLKSTGEIISGSFGGNRVEIDGASQEVRFYNSTGVLTNRITSTGTASQPEFIFDVNTTGAGGAFVVTVGGDEVLALSQGAQGKTFVTLASNNPAGDSGDYPYNIGINLRGGVDITGRLYVNGNEVI
jgi:hypothetical protein